MEARLILEHFAIVPKTASMRFRPGR